MNCHHSQASGHRDFIDCLEHDGIDWLRTANHFRRWVREFVVDNDDLPNDFGSDAADYLRDVLQQDAGAPGLDDTVWDHVHYASGMWSGAERYDFIQWTLTRQPSQM